MKVVELIRLEDSYDYGTFGVLKINKETFCVTIEPPDTENKPRKSCIPSGQYSCVRYKSPTFGETFMVEDVPNRSAILFHAGNTRNDTAGCIIIGQYFGKLREMRAILNSGKTFKHFMGTLDGEERFHLTISESY